MSQETIERFNRINMVVGLGIPLSLAIGLLTRGFSIKNLRFVFTSIYGKININKQEMNLESAEFFLFVDTK